MAKIQFDLPLGNSESLEEESLNGIEVGFKETRLRSGVGIEDKTYQRILTSYPDYKDNSDDYQQFAGLMDNNRARYTHALNNKTFALDEDDNIIDGENGFVGSSLLYDMEAMRGYMLAENNGFNSVGFDSVYATITEEESKSLAKEKEGTSLIGQVAGSLGAYAYDPLTLIDIASPGKIIASTVLKGAAKAFGVEAAFAATSEIARQEEIKKHMARAGLEYTLWDSTKEIIMNAGFGGLVRGIGSAVVDYKTFSKINSGITNATDKEIFQRFAKRENFKLTQNTTKHIQIMEKVEDDINNGKDVDVSALTDIDINTKVDPNIQPVSIIEELSNDYKAKGYDIEEKALDDNIKAKPIVDDVYGGMATNDDGDALIKEFYSDAEIQAELKQIEEMEMTLSRDEELALAEDTKPKLQGFQAQEMTVGTETINKTDFDLIQKRMKTREFNRKNPDNQRIVPQLQEDAYNRNVNIADDLKDLDFEAGGSGAVFSKFADNLAAGTVAGVEEDEQGNITFNPEKFVAGLGGYTAAKTMFKAGAFDGLPEAVNSQVKKYFGVDLQPKIAGDTPEINISTEKDIILKGRGVKIIPNTGNKKVLNMDKIIKTKEFKKWFKDSKVVDENSEPLVVYHGTSARNDFEEFKKNKAFYFTDNKKTADGFSEDASLDYIRKRNIDENSKDYNKFYNDDGQLKKKVYTTYLDIKKPFVVEADSQNWDELPIPKEMGAKGTKTTDQIVRWAKKSDKYDGVIFKNIIDGSSYLAEDNYVVFNPTQIKSVENRGTFSKNDANILKSLTAGTAALGIATQEKEIN